MELYYGSFLSTSLNALHCTCFGVSITKTPGWCWNADCSSKYIGLLHVALPVLCFAHVFVSHTHDNKRFSCSHTLRKASVDYYSSVAVEVLYYRPVMADPVDEPLISTLGDTATKTQDREPSEADGRVLQEHEPDHGACRRKWPTHGTKTTGSWTHFLWGKGWQQRKTGDETNLFGAFRSIVNSVYN